MADLSPLDAYLVAEKESTRLSRAAEKASRALSGVADRMERASKPLTELRKSFGRLAETSGLAGVGETLKNVGTRAFELGRNMARWGTAGADALGSFIKRQADVADAISDTAARLNIGRGAFQEYTYAFKLFGVDSEETTGALDTLSKNLNLAKSGMGEALPLFRSLGIDPARFQSVEQLLPALADGLARVSDQSERASIAGKLLGDSAGGKMAALLGKGSAELGRLQREARAAGAVIRDDALDGAAKLNNTLGILGLSFRGVAGNVLGQLYPALTKIAVALQEAFVRNQPQIEAFVKDFAEKLPQRLETAEKVFGSLRFVAGMLANALRWCNDAFGTTTTVVGVLAMMVGSGGLTGALGSLILMLGKVALESLVAFPIPTLIALAVAAVAAGGVWIWKHWDQITKAISGSIDWLVEKLTGAWDTVKSTALAAFEWIAGVFRATVQPLIDGFDRFKQFAGRIFGSSTEQQSAPAIGTSLMEQREQRQQVAVSVDFSDVPVGVRTYVHMIGGMPLALSRGFARPGVP
jgi:hypothetical protein